MGKTPYLSISLDPEDPGLGEESYGRQHQAQDEAFCKALRAEIERGLGQKPAAPAAAPQSSALRAFVAGLGIDPSSRALGRRDGAKGWPNKPPPDCDALSYYAGYRDGEMFGDKP
jgi:hypothetical protein